MTTKAYEMLAQVKDYCLYNDTSRDNYILQKMNQVQTTLYNAPFKWRALEKVTDLYTVELLTLNVAPSTPWAVGDTITGATSETTSTVVSVLSTTTFLIKDRSDDYTAGEVLSNGTYTADQGTGYPTVAASPYLILPADIGVIYDIRQTSDSPYTKLVYLSPREFHRMVPQPTQYSENKPTHYTWFEGKLWFIPIPDEGDTYTLTVYYYRRPTAMKLYSTGTASVSGAAVTGSSTYFSTNANVDAGMFFAFTADTLSDGSYAWSEIAAVSSATGITLKASYAGGTSTGSYIISSAPTFDEDFVPYIVYQTAFLECGRNRELKETATWLKGMADEQLRGLVIKQTTVPDHDAAARGFRMDDRVLGDDAAKYPFIRGNL